MSETVSYEFNDSNTNDNEININENDNDFDNNGNILENIMDGCVAFIFVFSMTIIINFISVLFEMLLYIASNDTNKWK